MMQKDTKAHKARRDIGHPEGNPILLNGHLPLVLFSRRNRGYEAPCKVGLVIFSLIQAQVLIYQAETVRFADLNKNSSIHAHSAP